MRVLLMRRSPHLPHQLRLRHHAARMRKQQRQQLVFLARQRHRQPRHRDLTAARVDAQMPIVEHRHGLVARRVRTQEHPDARHQFLRAEGLGHVIVGARIQRGHDLGFTRPDGQHHHRRL
ncbi:hypothetical protein ISE1_3153 [plant metagenome]|uniref:Uncharacterized protein n=1 Tax=plant metagenome TaxID=1297885 RepID=A0A484U2B6_9ZZZZ